MKARKIEISTLRTLGDDGVLRASCTEGRQCVGLHRVADRAGRTYVVVKDVDLDEAAAFAPLVGKGERVGWVPDELLERGV